jgi:HD superfamily phosphohydrolase
MEEEGIKQILSMETSLFDDYLIELIKIAGLVHDIGHGPFSHLFDEWLKSKKELETNKLIHHENRSIMMLGLLIETSIIKLNNETKKVSEFINFDAYKFISTLINPSSFSDIPKKNFIYQIISNNLNDLDVDKLDYLCRDSYYLACGTPFNINTIIEHIKVMDCTIVFPEKISYEIYKVYRSRYDLYKQFYNHKIVISIEFMLRKIMDKLDNLLNITKNIANMNIEHFANLTDASILTSTTIMREFNLTALPNYEKLMDDINYVDSVINAINQRKFYKCIYTTSYSVKQKINGKKIIKKLMEENPNLLKSNIITYSIKIGLIGGEKTHPFDNLYFVGKKSDKPRILSKNEISYLMSTSIQEKIFFVIVSNDH